MENQDFYNIPIFIISYNRKETLKMCVERFQKDGYRKLIILDNASTDEATIEYLKGLSCNVVFLKKIMGIMCYGIVGFLMILFKTIIMF